MVSRPFLLTTALCAFAFAANATADVRLNDSTGAHLDKAPSASGATREEKEEARAAAKAQREAAAAEKKANDLRAKGPYEPDVEVFLHDRPAEMQPYYRALFVEGERNAVLNFDRIGLLELQRKNLAGAKWAFDHALQRIEMIYAKDPAAKAAKSTWIEEKIKDFKGEPYERAMAYYYRGLIYLMEGDFQNARASFISGEYQDTVSESEEFQGDFALMDYLSGWASHCDGNETLATEYFGYAKEANEALAQPPADHNTLMLFEVGTGPKKKNSGKYGEYLMFDAGDRGQSNVTVFTLAADGGEASVEGREASSVSFQAMTRGGKPFQSVLNGKAQFKEIAGAVGTVATTAGVTIAAAGAQNRDNNAVVAGAAVALFGLVAKAASNAAQPAADTRYWDMLPDAVDLATAHTKQQATSITAQPTTAASTPAGRGGPTFIAGNSRCTVAWGREFAAAGPPSAPNTAFKGSPNKAILAKDAKFRATLLAETGLAE